MIRRRVLRTRSIKMLVLDEADEMLNKGFKEQIYDVYRYLPPATQVIKEIYQTYIMYVCGPGSSVGIATDYGLDSLGNESRWGRFFLPVQTGPGAHPASCKMGTGSFLGHAADHSPPSSAEVMEE